MNTAWHPADETQELRTAPAPPRPKQRPWFLLTGLVLGFILGLVYAWLLNPVVYANSIPASLKDNYKDTYRSTIAQVYAATGDLDRAQRRLALLEDADPVYALGAQAQRLMAEGRADEARTLALLAAALQSGVSVPTATATSSPIPTQTLPAITATP